MPSTRTAYTGVCPVVEWWIWFPETRTTDEACDEEMAEAPEAAVTVPVTVMDEAPLDVIASAVDAVASPFTVTVAPPVY